MFNKICISLVLFASLCGSACQKSKDSKTPEPAQLNPPVVATSGDLATVSGTNPAPVDECQPGRSLENCQIILENIEKEAEANTQTREKIEAEMKNLYSALGEAGKANQQALITLAQEKASLEKSIDALKIEAKNSRAEVDRFEKSLSSLKLKAENHDLLVNRKAELDQQLSQITADSPDQELLQDEIAKLNSQLRASEAMLRGQNKLALRSVISISRQNVVLNERIKASDSSRESELTQAISAESAKITRLEMLLKADRADEIHTEVKSLYSNIPQVEATHKQLAALYAEALDHTEKDLASKNEQLNKAMGESQDLKVRLEELTGQIMSVFKERYAAIEQLEASLAAYIRASDETAGPESILKSHDAVVTKYDALKIKLADCLESDSTSSRRCLTGGQELFNLDRQRKLLLIDLEYIKIFPSNGLQGLNAESKSIVKGLWEQYQKALKEVVDVRPAKSLTDKELLNIEEFLID